MTVETYWTPDGTRYEVIRCRPIEHLGPGHELPPYVQLINQEADRLANDIGEHIDDFIDERPVYVEIITDEGRADYEVVSTQWVKGEPDRYNLRRRT